MNYLSKKYKIYTRISLYNDIFNNNDKLTSLNIKEIDHLIYKVKKIRKDNNNLHLSLPPLLTPKEFPKGVNPGCGWAYHVVGILFNGDVTICGPASGIKEMVAGNILEKPFYNIWEYSNKFKNLRKYNFRNLKGICGKCPINDICYGFCRLDSYLRYGDICNSFYLCQNYYEAMLNGEINRKAFPSKILELDRV